MVAVGRSRWGGHLRCETAPVLNSALPSSDAGTASGRAGVPRRTVLPPANHLVTELRESGPVGRCRDRPEGRRGDGSREEGSPAAECHGRDLDDDLIEQAVVVELPNQLAAAHKPDVLAGRRFRHLSMHEADVSGCESDICTRYDAECLFHK